MSDQPSPQSFEQKAFAALAAADNALAQVPDGGELFERIRLAAESLSFFLGNGNLKSAAIEIENLDHAIASIPTEAPQVEENSDGDAD